MTIPVTYKIRDRGATPRGMAKRLNGMKKAAWNDAAVLFHSEMRDNRFTSAHARAAGYERRTRRYQVRKQKKFGHTNPLEWSGRTRRAVRAARIAVTSHGAKVTYAGARTLNFRNPNSKINAAMEFAMVIDNEANQLAAKFDKSLDRQLSADRQENN